jgi:hypothetical protein
VEQRRLADPGLPADHQRTAVARARAGQQGLDPVELGFPSDQHAFVTP